jgi:phospholipid transport system substrate-binding protein
MRLDRRTVVLASLSALAAMAGGDARADPDPKAFVADLGQKAIAVLADKSLDAGTREQRLGVLLRNDFDLPLISRLALGITWRRLDDGQRSDYQKLFSEYVLATYAARFSSYAGQRFEVTGSHTVGDGDVLVTSRIMPAGGAPIQADWRVRQTDGKPRIIDVVVAGVSLVVTQRNEFQSVVQGKGFDGLMTLLRQRIGQAQPG